MVEKLLRDAAFLRRLAIVVGVAGALLVVMGVALAARIGETALPYRNAGGAITFFMLTLALPGALLFLTAGPIWRAHRWAAWLAQLVGGYLVVVWGWLAMLMIRARGLDAPATMLPLGMTIAMLVLIAYLVRGGWAMIRLHKLERKLREAPEAD